MNYWQKFDYNTTYHLYNKSVSRRKLFRDHQDYIRFITKFQQYFGKYVWLYSYCLIPNHFHFMFRIRSKEEFSPSNLFRESTKSSMKLLKTMTNPDDFMTDQLKRWISGTAKYLNGKYNLQGSVFLQRTKRISIPHDNKFLYLLCYIHHNPIHHGLVKKYTDWKYSSYLNYHTNSEIISGSNEILNLLGNGDLKSGIREFDKLHMDYKKNFIGEPDILNEF